MAALLKEISTITAKGQTTVPKSVRKALDVGYGDQIAFVVDENGVTVQRADTAETDPVIDSFLGFLARDMEAHPETMSGFPPALRSRIAALTKGMKVDPDARIDGEVDL
jgi:antitoxin PrlF